MASTAISSLTSYGSDSSDDDSDDGAAPRSPQPGPPRYEPNHNCFEGFADEYNPKQRLRLMRNPNYQFSSTSIAETLPAPGARLTSTALGNAIVAAPVVELNASLDTRRHLDPSATEVKYNPRY